MANNTYADFLKQQLGALQEERKQQALPVPLPSTANEEARSATPFGPIAVERRTATVIPTGRTATTVGSTTVLQTPEREAQQLTWRERALEGVSRGLRGIGAALSPLQLGQDILFSFTHGILDKERSVWDNFKEMEWGKYNWWNEAPKRVVTGADILEAVGVKNERSLQWGGIALDLFADPLIVGAYLRGVNKIIKLPALTNAANRIDDVTQSVMLLGGLPTTRSVGVLRGATQAAAQSTVGQAALDATANAYMRVTSPQTRAAVQRRMDEVADFTTKALFDIEYAPIKALGGRSIAGLFRVDGGRDPELVRNISRAIWKGKQPSQDVAWTVGRLLARAGDERAAKHLERLARSQTVHFRQIPERLQSSGLNNVTSEAIDRASYGLVDQVSPLWGLSRKAIAEVDEAMPGFSELERVMRSRGGAETQFVRQQNLFDSEVDRIYNIAVKNGDDADLAVRVFRENVDDIMKADALLGYNLTLMPYLREEALTAPIQWLERLKNSDPRFAALDDIWSPELQRDWAARMWRDGLHTGMTGNLNDFYNMSFTLPQRVLRTLGIRNADEAPRFAGRQMFEQIENLGGIKPGDYLKGIVEGHLRRSFGVFQDGASWSKNLDNIATGRVVVKNIINDAEVLPKLEAFDPEATRLARDYLNMMTPGTTEAGRSFGVTVSQRELVKYMVDNGVTPQRAEEFIRTMVKEADQPLARLVNMVEDFLTEQYGIRLPAPPVGQRIPDATQVTPGFLRSRKDIDETFLAGLGENIDPYVSLLETAARSQQVVSKQLALKEVLDYAARNPGLVLPQGAPKPHGFVTVASSQFEQYGALAGKNVHPLLIREIDNIMASAKNENQFFRSVAMLRSMVSGGYLANPATTTANVFGGFFTALLYGQNPISLAGEMAAVYKDLKRLGNKLPDLEDMGFLLGDTLTQRDIYRIAPTLSARKLDNSTDALAVVREIGENLYSGYQQYVMRKPLGIGALGLEPFEMSENLFRIAAYRQAIKKGMSRDDAVDYARFIVFDYGAQPGLVQMARDSGVFLFPAFPYFMLGRTFNAAVNRPQVLSMADRMSEAVWNAVVPNEDERLSLWGAQNDWMRNDRYVPIWQIKDEQGNPRGAEFFSFNQLVPTNTLTGSPFIDQLESVGLWGPTYDLMMGIVGLGGTGEAPFGQATGKQLFSPGDTMQQRIGGLFNFAYNSFAPGFARKLISPGEPEMAPRGLLPALYRSVIGYDDSFGDTAYSVNEVFSRKPDRSLAAEAFSFFVRGTRSVVYDGPAANMTRPLQQAQREHETVMRDLAMRRAVVKQRGDERSVKQYDYLMEIAQNKFLEEWGPYIEMARAGQRAYGGRQ